MKKIFVALASVVLVSGCASYRTSSNVPGEVVVSSAQAEKVEIFPAGQTPQKSFKEIQRMEVSIKKLTAFHADPTRQQANDELKKRAAALGGNGVINVQYQSGFGLTTWGYMDAQGVAVKFVE